MRILVAGAGALGGFFGGMLARAGEDVTFLARGKTLDALRSGGLTVRAQAAGEFNLPVQAVDHLDGAEPSDLVIFTVKAYDLDDAARAIAPVVGEHTAVLAVQNGIEHPQRLARIIGDRAIVPGIVYISVTARAPGVIQEMGDDGFMQIGPLEPKQSPLVALIADSLRNAGVTVHVHDDIWPHLWCKFMDICAFSGLTALTRLTFAQLIDVPETRAFYRDVMAEILPVARANGCELPDSAPDEHLELVESLANLPERGSMAFDLLKGRPIEIDTLNGAVVRLGQQHGIDTPLNRAITAALLPYRYGSPESQN